MPRSFPKIKSNHCFWKRAGWLLLAGACPLLYLAGRSYIYYERSQTLFQVSRQFPTDYFVGDQHDAPLTYVVLGDSTAVGTGVARLQDTYPYAVARALAERGRYVHVNNLAVSGARIGDVEKEQLARLGRIRPDVLTLSVGANDATHNTPPLAYAASLRAILQAFRGLPARCVLIADTPDMTLIPAIQPFYATLAGGRAQRQNAMLETQLTTLPFRRVNVYRDGKLDARRTPDLYAPDRFHPSAAGYQLWATLFVRQLPSRL